MKKNITKDLVGDLLTITVTVTMKEYLRSPTESIIEEDIIRSVYQNHEVIEVVSKPDYPVGNHNRKGMKQKGVWIFRIASGQSSQTSQTKPEAKPKKKTTTTSQATAKKPTPRKPPPAKKPAPKKTSTKPSIRGRIKKISEDTKQQ